MKQPHRNGIDWLFVERDASIRDVLSRFDGAVERSLPSGIVLVVDDKGRLSGTITDGDIRRAILREESLELKASQVMREDPVTFREGTSFQTVVRELPSVLEGRGRRGRMFLGKIILVDSDNKPTRVLDYHQLWEQRVATHRHIVVVGLGYVGLTLGLRLAELGFRVTGVDIDASRIAMLSRGESYVHELGLPELLREQLDDGFALTTEVPPDGDVFVVTVGTPVASDGARTPKLEALREATRRVGAQLSPNALIILRSTVPLGATREIVAPLLEETSGLRAGVDFHLAFAPERTVEGRALQELSELPQLIGGINEDSVEATVALFRDLTSTIVRMESLEAAEMAKLINNSYRDLIFAFSNEMTRIGQAFNLDVTAVITAANRGYPRDKVPLPSPGVGGPCLTKDPYILAAAAGRAGMEDTLSHRGRSVNESMPGFVADALIAQLKECGKDPKRATVLVCGLAFKGRPETGDLRDSTPMEIAKLLEPRVGTLKVNDPVVSDEDLKGAGLSPVEIPAGFAGADAVLFLNNHPAFERVDPFEMVRLLASPGIVYDAWRLFRQEDLLRTETSTVYMGLGFSRSAPKIG